MPSMNLGLGNSTCAFVILLAPALAANGDLRGKLMPADVVGEVA